MNSQSMQFLMIVSAAYFAYDFIACVYYDLSDVSLVCHHALAMTGYAVSIMSKFGAPPSICTLRVYFRGPHECGSVQLPHAYALHRAKPRPALHKALRSLRVDLLRY